jgi:hypothetical protein
MGDTGRRQSPAGMNRVNLWKNDPILGKPSKIPQKRFSS